MTFSSFLGHFINDHHLTNQITSADQIHLRVVFLSDRVYPYFKGGAEKRYWKIAQALARSKWEVQFYSAQWPGMPKYSLVDDIDIFGVYPVEQFYVNGRKSIKESVSYCLHLLPYLWMLPYDLIECDQFPLLPIFAAKFIAVLRHKPLIVTWHEVWGRNTWVGYIGKIGIVGAFIEHISFHLADHIISVSDYTTRQLLRVRGLKPHKISTIPNGISFNVIRSVLAAEESSDIIYVGRLASHKRVDILLEAVACLKKECPNVQCFIIGDGPERSALENMSRKLSLMGNVHFWGHLEDDTQVYSLIKSSRVFVLPSVREGFGIVVPEANACGIPAIVVRHPDNAACDLIEEGVNGYICNLDSAEIANQILCILREAPEKYSVTSRKAAEKFSWELVGTQVWSVYHSAIFRKKIPLRDLETGVKAISPELPAKKTL